MADYLTVLGFRIVGTNVRVGRLELDVIATLGDLAAIVEVRTRGPRAFTGPFESIGATKKRRVLCAAQAWWQGKLRRTLGVSRLRVDAAAVYFDGSVRVEYVEAAFG